MKRLSPTPTLRALLRATPLFASSENKFFLPASSTTVSQHRFTVAIFWVSSVTGHAPQRTRGTLQNRLFPQLNLHKARVRRNRGRPPPNGFTGRARSSSPRSLLAEKRASGKVLALTGRLSRLRLLVD
jgi:hypothetical protein